MTITDRAVKSLNLIFSNTNTLRYRVGGSEWEESREERWGVVRDIPSGFQTATWVFPCFN